ncbi:hypothetical protein MHU86_25302 [Fragilaria crotonensis]|nr:hypothetical protein MHU86_25302 [Fragilaria crotonensis]
MDSNAVVIQRQAYNREGHFYLGVAVALCPSDWERLVREQVSIPRCCNSCCRTRLQTSSQGACARCTQILCSDCLVFHVKDANSRDTDALDDDHAICPECTLQILRVVSTRSAAEPGSDESRLVEEIGEALKQFFASLMDEKTELQHQILHYRVHQSFVTDAEVLSQRIEELQQIRLTLENQILQAQQHAKAAARTDHDESDLDERMPASDSSTPDEQRLQTRISEISTELNSIDWTTEEGTIRGSLLDYQLNEAMVDLGVAMSLEAREFNVGEETSTSEVTTEQIQDLECRCAAAMAEHDALIQKGPSNEHDHVFSMKVSELSHRYDQLSLELMQAKEELEQRQQSRALPVPALCPCTSAGETKSTSSAGDASRGDVMAPSNQASAGIDYIEVILPSLNATAAEIAISDLAAIGTIGIEEVIALPLDLHYPSDRIRHQVLVLRNILELARLESERALDDYYASLRQQLQSRVERLEDEIVTLHRDVANAQATAEEEERLRQERIARRAAAELRRKRLGRRTCGGS